MAYGKHTGTYNYSLGIYTATRKRLDALPHEVRREVPQMLRLALEKILDTVEAIPPARQSKPRRSK